MNLRKELITIHTHKGLYQFNHLWFGVSSTPWLSFSKQLKTYCKDWNMSLCISMTFSSQEEPRSILASGGASNRLEKAGLHLKKAYVLLCFHPSSTWDTSSLTEGIPAPSQKRFENWWMPGCVTVKVIPGFVQLLEQVFTTLIHIFWHHCTSCEEGHHLSVGEGPRRGI